MYVHDCKEEFEMEQKRNGKQLLLCADGLRSDLSDGNS